MAGGHGGEERSRRRGNQQDQPAPPCECHEAEEVQRFARVAPPRLVQVDHQLPRV
jgi:hypothetical protein